MTRRSALIIAAGITAFVLVFAGALVTYMAQVKPQAANTTEQTVASAAVPDTGQQAQPDAVQTMQAVLAAREAAYQQQLDEANRRIEEANTRLQQLYDRFGTPTATDTPQAAQPDGPAQQPVQFAEATPTAAAPEPEQPAITISPRDAAIAALGIARGATLTQVPQIVSYGSTTAYEVVLDRGNVYVDAANGQVLYNGAAAARAAPAQPSYSDDDHQENGEDD